MVEKNDIQSKITAINEAQSPQHVLDVLEGQLRKHGATHILTTGLPMPNRPIDGLIHRFRWPDERNGGIERSMISPDDSALLLGLTRSRAFIWNINEGDAQHSELLAAIGANGKAVVVPVSEFHPFQALVVGAGEHIQAGPLELSNLDALCAVVFRRLAEIGSVSIHRPGDLSVRERRVLELTALGKTANDIALVLDISQRTVHAHLQNASVKLNATNKTHTVVEALRYGQIRV